MPSPKDRKPIYVNRLDLAAIIGLSPSGVDGAVKRGMPLARPRQFNVADAVQWYIADRIGHEATEVQDARRRLYATQEKKARLELARSAGLLIDVESVNRSHMAIASLVSSTLRTFGRRMASVLEGKSADDIRTAIERECSRLSGAVADLIEREELAQTSGGDPTSPASKKPGSVGRPKSTTPGRKPRARGVAQRPDSVSHSSL